MLRRYRGGGGSVSKYVLATNSVVNATVLGKPSTAAMIKEVRIEVTTNDGAVFDTSQAEGSTGCYPPVDFKSKEEKILLGSIGNLALKAVVTIFEIKNVVLVYGAKAIIKLVSEFDGAKTEETNTSSSLTRTFRWNDLQAQTNQIMTFYPIFPKSGGSFDIDYTMVSGKSGGASGFEKVANTLHVENPYSS